MKTPSNKLLGFDAVRGIAAMLVFLFHFWAIFGIQKVTWQNFDFSSFFSAGHVGLDIFFVLSGFLIFRSLYEHGVNLKYFQRRVARLAPLYYLSLAICLIFLVPELFLSREGLWNIFSHLLFLQSFSEQTYYGINPVLWSLSVEMLFYLFLPVFFLITRKKTWAIIAGILTMIVITYIYRYQITQFYPNWTSVQKIIYTENFIGRLDQFAFGMLSSLLVIKLENSSKTWLKILSIILGCVAIAGIFYGIQIFHTLQGAFRDYLTLQIFLHSFLGFSTGLFLLSLSQTFTLLQRIMGNIILEFLGKISYSFYVWHLIIIEEVKKIDLQSLYGNFLLSLSLTLGLSILTYYLIERSFLLRKKY